MVERADAQVLLTEAGRACLEREAPHPPEDESLAVRLGSVFSLTVTDVRLLVRLFNATEEGGPARGKGLALDVPPARALLDGLVAQARESSFENFSGNRSGDGSRGDGGEAEPTGDEKPVRYVIEPAGIALVRSLLNTSPVMSTAGDDVPGTSERSVPLRSGDFIAITALAADPVHADE